MIIFITGGARSGKSRYAQELACAMTENPVYIATARHWDKEFDMRIERHQDDRDERWTTVEEETLVSKVPIEGKVVVVDCVTLWLTNFFTDSGNNTETSLALFKNEIDLLSEKQATIIIISNELGMGIHAETEIGRRFTDLQGWTNQYVAEKASKVIFMVSGIPMLIKPNAVDKELLKPGNKP
jgi:adenosylcobinamide kinase/adenosylcobinamide-phosphate guanylyltransferase